MQLAWPTPGRAWWTVAVLTFTYIVSFVDRTILGLLIEPIKLDLSLNDTQIGWLAGPAFGVFYAVMGLPLGWLADRISRRGLIAVGAALWCAATAACGLAGSFVQLFIARISVGVGEAALSPAAMSIISDSFPKERRAAPIGVYAAAAAVGAGLAMIVGGTVIQLVSHRDVFELPLIGEVERWQAAFVLVGVGGLVLLPLLATILEPVRRNEFAAPAAGGAARIDHFIGKHADFMVRHYVAVSFYSVVVYAVLVWVPAQFIRVHGWTAGETGLRYGFVLLLFGGAGTVLGGILSAHFGKRGVAQPAIWITVIGMAAAGPLLAAAGLAGDGWNSLLWYAPALLFMTLPGGTAIQVVQEAVPNRLRGQASAIYYLSTSIIGNTLGPLSVGLLTDYVYGDPLRIGSALAILAIVIAPLTALLALSTRAPFARLVGQQATA
ncbi:MAG TPA: MFS transporter [Steroidobacteraceae bacterium]|nr:MFS transporter [Steroidobacteraceae bacterium]